jgi:hypothetical protein
LRSLVTLELHTVRLVSLSTHQELLFGMALAVSRAEHAQSSRNHA